MSAESIKKKQLTKLPKPNSRADKIIDLKTINPDLTTREIAKLTDCTHSNVVQILQRYGVVHAEVNDYKTHRADILASLQHRLISSITDEDVKKAPTGSRILAACQLYDKERLERGQSSVNIAQITADIARLKNKSARDSDENG